MARKKKKNYPRKGWHLMILQVSQDVTNKSISFKAECFREPTLGAVTESQGKVAIGYCCGTRVRENQNVSVVPSSSGQASTSWAALHQPFLQNCSNGHLHTAFLGIPMPGQPCVGEKNPCDDSVRGYVFLCVCVVHTYLGKNMASHQLLPTPWAGNCRACTA